MMYTAQLAILSHLAYGQEIIEVPPEEFDEVGPTTRGIPLSVKTIKAYAGELRDAVKLAELHPAIFVWMREASPLSEITEYAVDLIVVTNSKSFDKETNLSNNLEIAEDVANYLGEYYSFNYADLPWIINTEELNMTTLMINNEFAIVKISFSIRNLE